MMPIKNLSLSLVIPVYNEEFHLKACLESIAKQTAKPKQVIVVNNNSTDKTVNIAKEYSFVTVIEESKQGQVFAQATGFNEVKADIIGRIDADTILPPDWVERVTAKFSDNSSLAAISGPPDPYDMKNHRKVAVKSFLFYHLGSSRIAGHPLLWGSNTAFRSELWPTVRNELHYRPDVWEDYDLSFALAKHGRLLWDKNLIAGCAFRQFRNPIVQQFKYQLKSTRTFWLNTGILRTLLDGLLRSSIIFSLTFARIVWYVESKIFN